MNLQLVADLRGGLKIYCNSLNWVLQYGNRNNRFYFSTLDDLCRELLKQRIIRAVLAKKSKKNITSLLQSITDANAALEKDLKLLDKTMTDADTARRKGWKV